MKTEAEAERGREEEAREGGAEALPTSAAPLATEEECRPVGDDAALSR